MMQKRPVRLTVMLPPVSEDRSARELDYALGYDPTIDRAKRPIAVHGAPLPEEYEEIDVVGERRRVQELERVCDRARADTLELRQRKAHHAAEVARLEQLVAFGDDPTYCRNCDLRMLNLQVLLRALGR